MKYLLSLESIEYDNLRPATHEDKKAIEKYLKEDYDLYYDEQRRVWTSQMDGIYIADLNLIPPSTVAEGIKKARNRSGVSQAGLAEMMKTTQQVISRYESGERSPSSDWVLTFCKTLKIQASEVFPEV